MPQHIKSRHKKMLAFVYAKKFNGRKRNDKINPTQNTCKIKQFGINLTSGELLSDKKVYNRKCGQDIKKGGKNHYVPKPAL